MEDTMMENEMEIDPEIFKEFENKMRLQEALGETPLAKNPFFIRTMSDPVFSGNGTEGVEPGNKMHSKQSFTSTVSIISISRSPTQRSDLIIYSDFSGYTCRFIGTLNCSDDFVKQCTGGGVIDCLGSCPGGMMLLIWIFYKVVHVLIPIHPSLQCIY